MSQMSFLMRVVMSYGSPKICPYCSSAKTRLAGRKKVLLELRRCEDCGLTFRWPGETVDFSRHFYQTAYKQSQAVTDLPDAATLAVWKANNFAGSPVDFAVRLDLLQTLVPTGRVLDFGCSWGYAVFQMKQRGFDAVGFEISEPRARAGREALGVDILESLEELAHLPEHSFDAIFSAHVLEHLPNLKDAFATFLRLLKPGGTLLAMVPNCGGTLGRELGVHYGPAINEKHVNAFRREFFDRNLPAYGFSVSTLSGYDDPVSVREAVRHDVLLPADGEDLTVVAVRS